MTTSGVDINKYVDELTAIRGLVEINVSFNTTSFEKLLSTLRLFKKHEQQNEVYLNLACPITHWNQNRLIDIIKHFENSNVRCIAFQHTTFTAHYNVTMDFNSIKKQVEKIKNTEFRIPVLFLPDIKPDDIQKYYNGPFFPYYKGNKCIAPWLIPFIQPNGDVIPCDEVNIVMGNVKKERLKKIWNNKEYRRFRENIQKHGISQPICNRCCHRQYY